nr:PREDICTED: enoyl-CoA delta isomerase 2, mitochondrial [Megachile rotundata]
MEDDILTSVENGMLKIILNRPAKKNAITILMYEKLIQLLNDSAQDNSLYVVVLTGTGNFFSSGNDFIFTLKGTRNRSFETSDNIDIVKKLVDTLILYPKLLIVIVNGPAIGIATTILPLFDIIYTSDTAYFHTPFTSLGLSAEGCSTYTFPKIFGRSKAGDMLYLGYKMTAFEAKQYGFVSEVYKYECLEDVWIYLKKLSQLSSQSILSIKRLVRKWNEKILLEVNVEETNEITKRMESTDWVDRFNKIILHKSKI